MRSWRVYAPGTLKEGARIDLDGSDSRHVLKVLRLQIADPVSVFNGQSEEWEGQIVGVEAGIVVVILGAKLQGTIEPGVDLTLCQGECRADRLEWLLQKGTEIGVGSFHLVRTARSDTLRWTEHKAVRWQKIIREACKQSGRRRIPDLVGPRPLKELPEVAAPDQQLSLLLHCGPGVQALSAVLAERTAKRVRILVGPESGLSVAEIYDLEGGGWTSVGMGPRILRTETAGLVAAALVLNSRGDLG